MVERLQPRPHSRQDPPSLSARCVRAVSSAVLCVTPAEGVTSGHEAAGGFEQGREGDRSHRHTQTEWTQDRDGRLALGVQS